MKQTIEHLIRDALTALHQAGELPEVPAQIQVEATKDQQFGDFATNIAMLLAKAAKKNPRAIAERIIQTLPSSPAVQKVEIAGPGFINFFLTPNAFASVVQKILSAKEQYGLSTVGKGKRVLVEFVSSNPTGPLHVGHGRHAAFGDVICRLLEAVGFAPYREYYVNDAGRQMDILTVSVWIRYLILCGIEIPFPANAYRGDYVVDISRALQHQYADEFVVTKEALLKDLPLDEPQGGDKELYIDAVIERVQQLIGKQRYERLLNVALESIMGDIADDLRDFGVRYDNWFSERELVSTNVVDTLLQKLSDNNHVYTKEGALWFRATDFGDEKDRVLVRSNGTRTYFANDVAYHLNKFERGFDFAIDILGSDHHGYIPRIKAALEACGIERERLVTQFGQFVTLFRGGEQVQMSTRGGSFVTLRELREEVGNDVARFFYIMRKYDHHIDFDLDLAKSQSNDNPVFYLQYAYARIGSVLRQVKEKNLHYDEANGLAHLDLLMEAHERALLNTLSRYPDMVMSAAMQYEPHLLTNYLRDLATDFHSYYNAHQFLVDDPSLRDARLSLVSATRRVLLNGLTVLGITAPETM